MMLAAFVVVAVNLYVAPDGQDMASGKKGAPFATLERARDELRKGKTRGTVFVRGGTYFLPRTFTLGPEDSGVTYRAFGKEKPVLVGGQPITGFVPHEGRILKAPFKGEPFRQIYYKGKRQYLARYPNFDPQNPYGGGWVYVDGKLIPADPDIKGESATALNYKAADERPWRKFQGAEVFIFARYNWWNNIVPIESIDRDKRIINLTKKASYAIRPGDRYYVQNLLEELDAPGEWYLDQEAATLYFWPPEEDPSPTVYIPVLKTIVEVGKGTSKVTLRGFTIEVCYGTAVVFEETSECLVAGNTIRSAGDYKGDGVSVSGKKNGVVGNDIYEIGSSAITIIGGDRATLTAGGNYVDNNYIHHTGVFYKQGVGVEVSGVGNRVAHNLIHDGPRMGIFIKGNNHAIEYNHVRHMNLETADTGAIYAGGRDYTSPRGTVIRYNYFHDLMGYGHEDGKWASPHFAWGIYLDDNASGAHVYGNIVTRAQRGLIHLHNGRDNIVENNVFVGGKLQQVEFNGWHTTSQYWAWARDNLVKGYVSVAGLPAWRGVRGMTTHPLDAVLPDGLMQADNVFRRNIIVARDPEARLYRFRDVPIDHNQFDHNLVFHQNGDSLVAESKLRGVVTRQEWAQWQARGQDKHSVVADPLFVDIDKDDFRLRPGSPAFKLGWKPIPVEKIGPQKDPLRASWPIVEAEGAREKPLNAGVAGDP